MNYYPSIKRLGEICYLFGTLWMACQWGAARLLMNSNYFWWISPLLLIGGLFTLCFTITIVRICEILHKNECEQDEDDSSSTEKNRKYPILHSRASTVVALIVSVLAFAILIIRSIYHL